jgi:hypothetical protein
MSLVLNFTLISSEILQSLSAFENQPKEASMNLFRLLNDLYENMEMVHPMDSPNFLKELLPPLGRILTQIPIQIVEGELQKIRNLVIEIFHRIPLDEVNLIFH